ncbi:ATP-binding protein [Egicoccus sp. AB-alg2]|uniref:ATP-binding protein n=1 Tax=Egicoccus sp. AB-alg2 TaxID=3242693 RepID=UPI00359D1D59
MVRVSLRNPDRVEQVEGPLTVGELLDRLDLNPTTVLVIHDAGLVTADHELHADAEVEIRPVISGGAGGPRCAVCRGAAVIEEPRHRAAWCPAHFVDHVQNQVRKAIDHPQASRARERMFSYADRLLVAVSGGKDSLALWDILLELGYRVDGLYIGLGIGGYSRRSQRICEDFAAARGARLHVVDLGEAYGYTTPSGASSTTRSACGVCGLSKRYVFNKVAVDHGYDAVVTGHNLDDEAATLLGNLLRWHDDFLARQRPVLPASGTNQVRKCKPLYRLSEREMAAYCVVRGIDYVVEECPLVDGNTGQEHKEMLNALERTAPGAKAQFLFGFLDRHDRFAEEARDDGTPIGACDRCGMPTSGETCAFCRQRERILTALPVLAGAGAAPTAARAPAAGTAPTAAAAAAAGTDQSSG